MWVLQVKEAPAQDRHCGERGNADSQRFAAGLASGGSGGRAPRVHAACTVNTCPSEGQASPSSLRQSCRTSPRKNPQTGWPRAPAPAGSETRRCPRRCCRRAVAKRSCEAGRERHRQQRCWWRLWLPASTTSVDRSSRQQLQQHSNSGRSAAAPAPPHRPHLGNMGVNRKWLRGDTQTTSYVSVSMTWGRGEWAVVRHSSGLACCVALRCTLPVRLACAPHHVPPRPSLLHARTDTHLQDRVRAPA